MLDQPFLHFEYTIHRESLGIVTRFAYLITFMSQIEFASIFRIKFFTLTTLTWNSADVVKFAVLYNIKEHLKIDLCHDQLGRVQSRLLSVSGHWKLQLVNGGSMFLKSRWYERISIIHNSSCYVFCIGNRSFFIQFFYVWYSL